MSLYRVKGFMFDLYLAAAVLIYLGALHVLLKGPAHFLQMFSRSSSRQQHNIRKTSTSIKQQ